MLENLETAFPNEVFKDFLASPLNVIDIGSSGEIFPPLLAVAPIIEVICFEADASEYQKLLLKYEKENPFAKIFFYQDALSDCPDRKPFYITKAQTSSSLLEPDPDFIRRYEARNFVVEKTGHIFTKTLDSVLWSDGSERKVIGEFLKLDTQGSEYEILKGADKILRKDCVAVWCEVEFFEVYKGQKTYADIDHLLRDYGLFIYGLYPRYRSKKFFNPTLHLTEERLMWADALFFKDPLDPRNKHLSFSNRHIRSLILLALLTHFYDFAWELAQAYYESKKELSLLEEHIKKRAQERGRQLLNNFELFNNSLKQTKSRALGCIRKFIDKNKSNASAEYYSLGNEEKE